MSVVSLTVIVLMIARALVPQAPIRTLSPAVPQEIGRLPLAFVPNAGQIDPQVRFQASGMGGAIFFTPQDVVLALNAPPQLAAQSPGEAYQSVVRQRFVGAAEAPTLEAADQLPGKVNFLTGIDPANWYTNLPTYAALAYRNLYPGIDLRYEGTEGALKSTFIVAPGVNPATIRWTYEGTVSRNTDQNGNLILTLPKPANAPADVANRTLSESAPVAWQLIDGRQIPVRVDFQVNGDNTVGFAVGEYNRAYPLIIDPTLTFSVYVGGNGASSANAVTAGSDGSVFLTGATAATNFPTSVGAFDTTANGATDVYVTRVNSDGSLSYSTYLGGSSNDIGNGIAVDASGRAYVVGSTSSANFPVGGVGANFDTTLGGSTDGFIVRLSSTGAALEHGSYLGGASNVDAATAVAVNASNEAFVTGRTQSNNFPMVGAFDTIWGGGDDVFVARVAANGASLLYSTYIGGLGSEIGLAIAVNGTTAYVGGETGSSVADGFPSRSAVQTDLDVATDGFVLRVDTSQTGNASLVYSTYLGGNGNDTVRGIAIDSTGNQTVLVGDTSSTDFPTAGGPLFGTNQGGQDAFVTYLSGTGTTINYSTYFGGSGNDIANGVALQLQGGNIVGVAIAGSTTSSDLPLPTGITQTPGGGTNAFATMFNGSGSALGTLRYSFYLGGDSTDIANGLALFSAASEEPALYLAGNTTSATNFPSTNPTGPLTSTLSTSGADAFLSRMILPTVSISDSITGENAGPLVFTVTVNAPANSLRLQDIRADYVISSGTALAGEDFGGALAGTAVLTPGQQVATITVPITDDALFELDETFTVTLLSAINATVSTTDFEATGTITNDDAPPTVAITDVIQLEGNGGPAATTFAFTTTLSAPAGITVTVPFSTSDLTALSVPGAPGDPDYVATTGVVTFAPGVTQAFANVPVNGDLVFEPAEGFVISLTLGSATNIDAAGSLATSVAGGVILNDDVPPGVIISDTAGFEDSGVLTFTVSLTAPSSLPVSVSYQTANDTALDSGAAAIGNPDYTAIATNTVTIAPGDTTAEITVTVSPDVVYENDETFFVVLTEVVDGGFYSGDVTGTGTISNDDALPALVVSDLAAFEGSGGGTTTFSVTVGLTGTSAVDASFTVTTTDGAAVSVVSATPGTPDYTAPGAGPYTIAAGTLTTTVAIQVNADDVFESDETFVISLTGSTDATISDGTATITITNDDTAPTISIGDVIQLEGNAGTSTYAFTATLSAASGVTATADFATSDGTATVLATAPGDPDYVAATGTITFAPGVTEQFVNVTVNGDTTYEGSDTFTVTLSNLQVITAGGSDTEAIGTIVNDDLPPTVSISDVTQVEGDAGTSTFVFTVTLSAPSAIAAGAVYNLDDGTATALATAPGDPDYVDDINSVIFAPGETTQFITVTVNGDTTLENDETFTVTLEPLVDIVPTGSITQATGTILNDDNEPGVLITGTAQFEGDSGTTPFTFTIGLTDTSGLPATVNWQTVPGRAVTTNNPATGDPDFTATSGSVVIPSGSLTAEVTINVNGDTVFEFDDEFFVEITSATNATFTTGLSATGEIVNDDTAPTVSISDVIQLEGNTGTTNFVFTATLSASSGVTATADFATSDGTATVLATAPGDPDYVAATGTITFAPGVTEQLVSVTVNGDTTYEGSDTFTVTLSNLQVITAGGSDTEGIGTIQNDDLPPTVSISDVTQVEGDVGTSTFVFTVTLSAPSALAAGAVYNLDDGTATALVAAPGDPDYVDDINAVIFAPGETTQFITVTVNGDTTLENNETFTVTLEPLVDIVPTGSITQAVGTILNDDAPPSVVITGVTDFEGTLPAGQSPFTFTIGITAPSALPVTISYETVDGTALGNGSAAIGNPDYASVATDTVIIPPGSLTATVLIGVNRDAVFESDEDFFVRIIDSTNATFTTGLSATGTIQNDDVEPSITISDVTLDEGNIGTTNFVFTATLSSSSAVTATADFGTLDGAAVSSGSGPGNPDYVAATGSISFAPGVTEQLITVTVNGDTAFENDETFTVLLTPTAAISTAGNDLSGLGTIVNDDLPPTVSISDVTANEGDTGTTNFVFTATLSAASALTATVDLTTQDGTAASASDYAATSGTITFTPGLTETTFSVPVTGDTVLELDETFVLSVTAFTNLQVTGSDLTGTGTIVNDDVPPGVVISDVTQLEGDSGTTLFTITVGLTATSGLDAIVNWTTTDGTALSSSSGTGTPDFTAASSSVTIPAGSLTATLTINVAGDTVFEADETFGISVTSVTSATIVDGTATITITNDDVEPTISISDVTLDEGNIGTTNFVFTATLSAGSAVTATADFGTLDGAATVLTGGPGNPDYVAATGSISFAPGVTEQLITVTVNGDTAFENDETFTVLLTPTAAISTAGNDLSGLGTIVNDDLPPTVSISDVTANEGDVGTTNFVFTVTLSAPSSIDATLAYTTSNGTTDNGGPAFPPDDFIDVANQPFTITAGLTETTVTVVVTGDTTFETDETFNVDLGILSGVTAAGSDLAALGTIQNDDNPPGLVITDVSALEANFAGFNTTFELTATSEVDVSISIVTQAGTATQIVGPPGGIDYNLISQNTTIVAGDLVGTVNPLVFDDTVYELDETLTVSITTATNATIVDGVATVTILNDDAQPSITISDVTQVEGDSGTSTFAFTATLSAASGVTATVDFATSDGTAISSGLADYVAASGAITFTPGVTQQFVSVTVNGDLDFEADETFTVTLSNLQEITATGSITEAIGTIQNDDAVPTLSVSDASVVEGDAGTASMVFTATLSARSSIGATFEITTGDGTAVAPGDYAAETNTLVTFAPNVTETTFTVTVNGDTLFEFDETFTVTLGSGVNLTIPVTDTEAIGTILNDDTAPSVTITGTSGLEGDSGTTVFTFDVELSTASGAPATLPFATTDGTAAAGTDYVSTTGTLVIPAGSTTGQITVTVNGDTTFEADETFFVTLVPAAPGTSGVTTTGSVLSATGTITNDDAPPTVNILDLTQAEGSPAGGNNFNITVELTAVSGVDVTVAFTTTDDTASSNPATPVGGADFTAVAGQQVTIPAGSLTTTATVVVNRDLHFEVDEAFTVTMDLVSVGAATPGDTTAVVTITNDDVQPTLLVSADNGGVIEGSSPPLTTTMQFTAILTAESYLPVSFDYAEGVGTAISGDDYLPISGTVTITPGDATGFFIVTVLQDTIYETNETVIFNFSNVSGATLANVNATGIITNDDGAPNLTLTGSSVTEGDPPGLTTMVVTATLDVTSAVNTVVDYVLVDTTTSPTDYVTPVSTQFIIPSGQLSTTFTIDAVRDQIAEQPAETFVVSVTTAPDVNPSTLPTLGRATMVITDDDYAPVSSSKTYTQPEDTQLLVTAGFGVLSGTTDLDDPTGPFTAVLVTGVSTGTLVLNGDGSFTYLPPIDFTGTEVFSFTVNDPHGNASITYTVSLIVQPVNDPPIANPDTFTVTRDSVANQLLVLLNDSVGPDIGDQLTIESIVVSPTNGTAVVGGGLEILYTPNPNFVGVDTLQYRVCDNGTPQLCAQAQVTIIVRDFRTYMPLVVKPPQSDLIVESIVLTPNKLNFVAGEEVVIAVTIRNIGETSTDSTFWVDLFIEPSAPPDTTNIRWNDRCNTSLPTGNNCRGIAWEVKRTLAPGESFTLYSTRDLKPEDGGLDLRFSRWPGNANSRLAEFFLPGMTSLYAYVDTWNPGVATGAVNEKFETNNLGQLLGLNVTSPAAPGSVFNLSGPAEPIPARPR